MGEAKHRIRITERTLRNQEFCIYCGGEYPATTVDHFPPRSLFVGRHRPDGLVFPACGPCNGGTRKDELLASFLSRLYPNPTSDEEILETKKLAKAVKKHFPAIESELSPSYRQKKLFRRNISIIPEDADYPINCEGPILNKAISRFAAKLGFGLHYKITKSPVPKTGGVCVWWLTNFNMAQGDVPAPLLQMLGPAETLRQGRWNVGEQFKYASISSTNGAMTAHYAEFRKAFAVCCFAAIDANKVTPPPVVDHVKVYFPGCFQKS